MRPFRPADVRTSAGSGTQPVGRQIFNGPTGSALFQALESSPGFSGRRLSPASAGVLRRWG
ncbi:MAG: hypothetical protein LBP22_06515 [Deltaproteobacteria bacterium]|nr:hypothetical protein [Deltaproteobacteria bacterium]